MSCRCLHFTSSVVLSPSLSSALKSSLESATFSHYLHLVSSAVVVSTPSSPGRLGHTELWAFFSMLPATSTMWPQLLGHGL